MIAGTLAYTAASFAVSIILAEREIIPLQCTSMLFRIISSLTFHPITDFDVRPLTGCLANFSDPSFYVAYTMIGVYDIGISSPDILRI